MTNNDTNRRDTAPADRDWFGGRRWTGIAAVGFLIVIALCVVVVVVINRGGGHTNTAGGATSTSSSSNASALTPSTTSDPAAALPTTPPTTAPAGTVWTIYQTLALPRITGEGPSKVSGAVATGYARTPTGALLAAANEGNLYRLAPDDQWRAAAAAMLAPGQGTQAWIAVRAKNLYGKAGAAGSDSLAQIAGFQFVSYTPSDAVIQLAAGNSTDGYQVASLHVAWTGNDWKFVPAADGGQAANLQQVDSLSGFIPWRGV